MVRKLPGVCLILLWIELQVCAAQSAPNIVGGWSGTLDINGAKATLNLTIGRSPAGKLNVVVIGPDNKTHDLGVTLIYQAGDQLRLDLTDIGASFEGAINAANTEITGAWKQGETSLPLVLRRGRPTGGVIGGLISSTAPAPRSPSPGLPQSLAGFEDEATFALILNEGRIGVMQSAWKKDGSFNSHAIITLAGQRVERATKIAPDAQGRWAKIVMESPDATATLTRDGVHVTCTVKDKTTTWETKRDMLLYDNNAPGLISQALRAYGMTKGGVQKFPLMIIPETNVELTLEAKETMTRSIAGKELTLIKFRYGLPEGDIYVFADGSGKIYMVDIPAQKTVFVREGYDELRKTGS